MIIEDFVSVEVAQLLKEKGFDEPCDNYYDQSSDEPQQLTLDEMYYSYDEFIKAPTHQMAMKWLREAHKLSIELFYMFPATWKIDIKYIDKKTDLSEFEDIRDKSYNSYEEAVEAALKYALESLT